MNLENMSKHERWSYFRTLGFHGVPAPIQTLADQDAYMLGSSASRTRE